jgi:hypothetical protein
LGAVRSVRSKFSASDGPHSPFAQRRRALDQGLPVRRDPRASRHPGAGHEAQGPAATRPGSGRRLRGLQAHGHPQVLEASPALSLRPGQHLRAACEARMLERACARVCVRPKCTAWWLDGRRPGVVRVWLRTGATDREPLGIELFRVPALEFAVSSPRSPGPGRVIASGNAEATGLVRPVRAA